MFLDSIDVCLIFFFCRSVVPSVLSLLCITCLVSYVLWSSLIANRSIAIFCSVFFTVSVLFMLLMSSCCFLVLFMISLLLFFPVEFLFF